jgi:hypothetical protein
VEPLFEPKTVECKGTAIDGPQDYPIRDELDNEGELFETESGSAGRSSHHLTRTHHHERHPCDHHEHQANVRGGFRYRRRA